MIAGAARTTGKTFELTVFNAKYPTTDPVTGAPLTPVPFQSTADGFSAPAGQPLPTLESAARVRAHRAQHVFGERVDHQLRCRASTSK